MPRFPARPFALSALLLLGHCLPDPAPYRCDRVGGDRACDLNPGARCLGGGCAAPVPTSQCATGWRYAASATEPGRCVPPQFIDADTPVDDAAVDASMDVISPLDHPAPPDHVEPLDLVAMPEVSTDTPAPIDAPVPIDSPRDVVSNDIPEASQTTPPSRVVQVVAGNAHTCARLEDGAVWCWGHNEQGQLGVGLPDVLLATPHRVSLGSAAALVAGAFHTCARTLVGEVFCWGRNVEGQLGDGGRQFEGAPVRVANLVPGDYLLASGSSHTCALDRMGGLVRCWGANSVGAAGQPPSARVATPSVVPGVIGRFLVAGDAFTCAGANATLQCWGRNAFGELGLRPDLFGMSASPIAVSGAVGVGESLTELYAGGFSVCARSTGGVRCWGRADLGAIPGTTAGAQPAPTPVPHFAATTPVLGYTNQCSVDASGSLRCWGANELGTNGDGSFARTVSPPTTALPFRVRAQDPSLVAIGASHACAADASGPLRCWGPLALGQLGDGRDALVRRPIEVPALRNVTALAAGRAFTCAISPLSVGNEVRCVGFNGLGQLGGSRVLVGTPFTVETAPLTVRTGTPSGPVLPSVTLLRAGGAHACARGADLRTHCWGFNDQGQLGHALAMVRTAFGALVLPASPALESLDVGASHTCGVTGGRLHCWGSNAEGQCGLAMSIAIGTGQAVSSLSGVVEVSAGAAFNCARRDDGTVTCFGANNLGQCGNGAMQAVVPLASSVSLTLRGVRGVSAGETHACAWTDTAVHCWGANNRGQLATPPRTLSVSRVPLQVGAVASVQEVQVGGEFTCARASGRVLCWGANYRGQLGDGTLTDREEPREVVLPGPARALAAGDDHACALLQDGRVFCWGSNVLAQLATDDPLWQLYADRAAVRWPR